MIICIFVCILWTTCGFHFDLIYGILIELHKCMVWLNYICYFNCILWSMHWLNYIRFIKICQIYNKNIACEGNLLSLGLIWKLTFVYLVSCEINTLSWTSNVTYGLVRNLTYKLIIPSMWRLTFVLIFCKIVISHLRSVLVCRGVFLEEICCINGIFGFPKGGFSLLRAGRAIPLTISS